MPLTDIHTDRGGNLVVDTVALADDFRGQGIAPLNRYLGRAAGNVVSSKGRRARKLQPTGGHLGDW